MRSLRTWTSASMVCNILVDFDARINAFAIIDFFWPVADTGLAIWRRWKLGSPTDQPVLVSTNAMRFIEIRFLGREKRSITNPLATVILVPFISTPQFYDCFILA